MRRWDLATGETRSVFRGHIGEITCIAREERQVVTGSEDTNVRVWTLGAHAGTANCLRVLTGHQFAVTAVGIKGNTVVSADLSFTGLMCSVQTGLVLKTLDGHNDSILCLVVQGEYAITGSADTTLRIWPLGIPSTNPNLLGLGGASRHNTVVDKLVGHKSKITGLSGHCSSQASVISIAEDGEARQREP